MKVRCPHCHNPIEVLDESSVRDIECPSCGSGFNLLRDTSTVTHQPQTPRTIAHFELTAKLGTGSFGTVYKARDTLLDRLVALKIPRQVDLDDAETEKFLREARAAAQLRHPSIVNVHEVGRDGTTVYIASDLVDGLTLSDWLTAQRLTPREAAELCVKLADAVHHAHECGVIHRDLKPSNVMLNAAGEPFVMDFGLAKREAGEITMTVDGQIIGTPAYMAPEQARGEGHHVDRRSDVYSLGVLLFELLTGERPFRGNARMLMYQVIHDEPPSPRSLNAAIPKDLETICLKCLEKDRNRRFASAAEFSAELRRYLANEPILSRPISRVERLWRWSKRNPRIAALSTVVAALLLAITVGSIVAVLLINDQRTTALELAGEKSLLATAKTRLADEARRASEQAQANARTANANAAIAREQSQLALNSLQYVVGTIQAKLKNIPGAGGLRRSLLLDSLSKLAEVSDDFVARSTIDQSTYRTLNELGDVFLKIGSETSIRSENVGPLSSARKAFERAFAIAELQAASDPASLVCQRNLAISHEKLGDVSRQAGQFSDALSAYQKAWNIRQKLATSFPMDAQAQFELSISATNLGDMSFQAGKLTVAVEFYQRGLQIRQMRATAAPTDLGVQRSLSVSYDRLGSVSLRAGELPEALEAYQKSWAITRDLAVANPTDSQTQRDLSVSYENLGNVCLQSGRLTQALEYYQNKLEISHKLATAETTDAQAQRDLAVAYNKLGNVHFQSGNRREALSCYQKFFEINQLLAAGDPTDAQAQRDLAVSCNWLGNVSLQSGDLLDAMAKYTKALKICQALVELAPNDAQNKRDLAVSYLKLGDVNLQLGQTSAAADWFQKLHELTSKLADVDPTDAQAQLDLYTSFAKLGEVCLRTKQFESAISSYDRALSVLEELDRSKRLPVQEKAQIGLMQSRIRHCKALMIALGSWESLLEHPIESLPALLEFRGTQFAKDGLTIPAIQAVGKLRELGTATSGQLYNAACVYSLCATSIKPAKGTDELNAEQVAEQRKLIDDALATLREAIVAGWKDFAHMQKDPDLTPLHDLPKFKALLPKP